MLKRERDGPVEAASSMSTRRHKTRRRSTHDINMDLDAILGFAAEPRMSSKSIISTVFCVFFFLKVLVANAVLRGRVVANL